MASKTSRKQLLNNVSNQLEQLMKQESIEDSQIHQFNQKLNPYRQFLQKYEFVAKHFQEVDQRMEDHNVRFKQLSEVLNQTRIGHEQKQRLIKELNDMNFVEYQSRRVEQQTKLDEVLRDFVQNINRFYEIEARDSKKN